MERKSKEWVRALTGKWNELGRIRYALLLCIIGIVVILIPTEKSRESEPLQERQAQEKNIEQRMQEVLSMVNGAGKVSVMLTEKNEGRIEYQTDMEEFQNGEQTERRIETVFSAQDPLIRSRSAPDYLGAVIVCEGGDRPEVCLELVDAVALLTGLTSDKITVLKMKD